MLNDSARSRWQGLTICVLVGMLLAVSGYAQDGTVSHEGLEVSVSHLERGIIAPLGDCPLGENIVRGVIAPGTNDTEFVTVHLDFKVLPDYRPIDWPRPFIHDVNGRMYRTAQTFGEMNRDPEFSCNFSFRVPVGMAVKEMLVDEGVALDLTAHDQ
ncbi:MAG TPA: hypothetical protein DD460_05615 [Acidobacteria bacterium]|jgi:hypothetical protein|nr:hypothetical protein [Woeseiaceae bacterium]HBO90208.1 hypothetical protein [Acidobacteriota bacterium]|tara:strand:+ start:348 stop:815 length:468 start_codon:yes stop_codon:yes gene_type:complete